MLDDVFDLVYLMGFVAASLIRAYWLKRTPHWWRSREKVAVDRERKVGSAADAPHDLGHDRRSLPIPLHHGA